MICAKFYQPSQHFVATLHKKLHTRLDGPWNSTPHVKATGVVANLTTPSAIGQDRKTDTQTDRQFTKHQKNTKRRKTIMGLKEYIAHLTNDMTTYEFKMNLFCLIYGNSKWRICARALFGHQYHRHHHRSSKHVALLKLLERWCLWTPRL